MYLPGTINERIGDLRTSKALGVSIKSERVGKPRAHITGDDVSDSAMNMFGQTPD